MSESRATPPPELVRDEAPSAHSYRRTYRVHGPPEAFLLQRVETVIRFLRDETCVVEYRGHYGEYFLLGAEPEVRLDVHDFDMARDGWGPSDIKRLLREHGLPDLPGSARLEVTKTFTIGPGEVEAATPTLTTPSGGAFGFLLEIDGASAAAEVTLHDGRSAPYGQALPFNTHPAGRGHRTGGGWRAQEQFRYRLATLRGRLDAAPYARVRTDGDG